MLQKPPRKRPKMAEVVKMMEDIIKMNTKPNLVFFEGFNPDFDIEDVLRVSAEVLGKGKFWYSYKKKLENGTIIVVNRLSEVIVTRTKFQQQMEVLGRIKHINVATLMAYYYTNDVKLVVYDYHRLGSVLGMLHGK